jgi:hypothetical protein
MIGHHQRDDAFPYASPNYLDNGSGVKVLQPKHRVDYSTKAEDLANALVILGVMHPEDGNSPGRDLATQQAEYHGNALGVDPPKPGDTIEIGTDKVPVADTAAKQPAPAAE